MKQRIYQVDAFASALFGGNPAAVCPLENWLSDELMQSIAAENNLSETAFCVANNVDDVGSFDLRWFTPEAEIDLCGHATLATAHVLFQHEKVKSDALRFSTRSGVLTVMRVREAVYEMDFPVIVGEEADVPSTLCDALGAPPEKLFQDHQPMAVFGHADQIRALTPDMDALADWVGTGDGLIVTAPGGDDFDCISRFFAPGHGIPEDPVTGSAHCRIVPYWAARLRKDKIRAWQASKRGGEVIGHLEGDRVKLQGQCIDYLSGWIEFDA